MEVIAKYLWIIGSMIFLILGSLHLYYTFFTKKFDPRDAEMPARMKNTFPVLTRQTTMWKAWIGFNASHSAGAVFIGLVNIILAVENFPVLRQSASLLLLNIIIALFYLWLAKKYWFRIPFTGIFITACCFIASATIILFQ